MHKTACYKLSWYKRAMMMLLSVHLSLAVGFAQSDTTRVFSESSPLIYEDVWDLWPYSFLNDNGDPDIRLKPSSEAYHDLKEGKSDLMLGLAQGFHDEFGMYSKNAVTLFTQSVVTPMNKPVEIKAFRDLGKPGLKVIVNDSSLCHHLMIDYGWGANALPDKDIGEAIQRSSGIRSR